MATSTHGKKPGKKPGKAGKTHKKTGTATRVVSLSGHGLGKRPKRGRGYKGALVRWVKPLARDSRERVIVDKTRAAPLAESRAALARRLESYVQHLVAQMPDEVATAAIADVHPADSVARLLNALPYVAPESASMAPLAPALARGAQRKRELLASTETATVGAFAELLDISPQALMKRANRGAVLALPVGTEYHLPVFQVDPRRHDVYEGLKRLFLAAAAREMEPWMVLEVVTTPLRDHGEATLAEMAKDPKRLDAALSELARFGEHGA